MFPIELAKNCHAAKACEGETFVIEVRTQEISISEALTLAQKAGKRGDYALAMSAWLRYLAATPAVWTAFQKERERLRAKADHPRTASMTGDLLAAFNAWFDFAVEAGAINEGEALMRFEQCQDGISQGTGEQSEHTKTQDPVVRFIQMIGMALTTGRAHLASASDGASAPFKLKEGWGWSRETFYAGNVQSTVMKPAGVLIGWTDEDAKTVWLEPTAAYDVASKLAMTQGSPFAVDPSTMEAVQGSWKARSVLEGTQERCRY